MIDRRSIRFVTLAAALCLPLAAWAQEVSKYPTNWEGQWKRGMTSRQMGSRQARQRPAGAAQS